MSLKSIDMSIAVHKNSDAALLQREAQHKPVEDQSALAQSSLKTTESSRQRAAKLDETDKSHIRERQKKGRDGSSDEDSGRDQHEEHRKTGQSQAFDHPFKGHHIDLSL